MNKLPIIKTARLRKAIDSYFKFKNKLFLENNSVAIPKSHWEQHSKICNEFLQAAREEGKEGAVIPSVLFISERMGLKRFRSAFIRSSSKFQTADWEMLENFF